MAKVRYLHVLHAVHALQALHVMHAVDAMHDVHAVHQWHVRLLSCLPAVLPAMPLLQEDDTYHSW